MNTPEPCSRNGGYTMVELLMVVAIIGLLTAIAIPLYSGAIDRSHRASMIHDAGELHRSFMRYNVDKGLFPSTYSPADRALNLKTLAPLSTEGYFGHPAAFTQKLQNSRIQSYDSPNIGASDTQFWATINSKRQPGFVLLVAHTNDLPLNRGTWYDGVYFVTRDGIEPVKETR